MGRGDRKSQDNSFAQVLGPRRSIGSLDSLVADNPSDKAIAHELALEDQLAKGQEDDSLFILNRWPSKVNEKPLLDRLCDYFCLKRIERELTSPARMRQLASDLAVAPDLAGTIISKKGVLHLWPEGAFNYSIEADGEALCGQSLANCFQAERGSWQTPQPKCQECIQKNAIRPATHLPELDETTDYQVLDSDLASLRKAEALGSFRFSFANELTSHGFINPQKISSLTQEAVLSADYEALAAQASRSPVEVISRLYGTAREPLREINWYDHLRYAGQRSERGAERREILVGRLDALLAE